MSDTSRIDIVTVELARPLMREYYDTLLATGDEYANRFGAKIVRNGNAVDLAGYTVSGSFVRPDGATVTLDGTKEGNAVFVDLTAPCYKENGKFTLFIKIVKADEAITVRMVDGYIRQTDTGNYVATDETLITLDQMKGLANELSETNEKAKDMMADLEGVSDEVEQAIEDASHVADKLPYIGENGNWWQWDDETGAFVDSGSPSRGAKGEPGNTPQKGVDYVDGTSVTVSSVSESAEDGGNNVVTFSDGKTLTVKNGKKGSKGDNGVGIQSVTQTTTSTEDGGSNVITVTKTDGSTSTFTVLNGKKGKDGTGVTILGSYASEDELKAAHPTGNAGDAYLIDGYLYVWSVTEGAWKNVGKIQGPQGDPGYTPVKGVDYFDGAPGYTPQKGVDYTDGKAATVQVGTVTTLPAGSNATVTNSGTENAAVFDFGIPRGADGSGGTGDGGGTSSEEIETIKSRLDAHAEATQTLQKEVDELGMEFAEYIMKIIMRLIQLERNAGLQPPVSEDLDTNTDLEDAYDQIFGQT